MSDEENPLQRFADENPDWIKRWLLCEKERENGNELPIALLQLETQIELKREQIENA